MGIKFVQAIVQLLVTCVAQTCLAPSPRYHSGGCAGIRLAQEQESRHAGAKEHWFLKKYGIVWCGVQRKLRRKKRKGLLGEVFTLPHMF